MWRAASNSGNRATDGATNRPARWASCWRSTTKTAHAVTHDGPLLRHVQHLLLEFQLEFVDALFAGKFFFALFYGGFSSVAHGLAKRSSFSRLGKTCGHLEQHRIKRQTHARVKAVLECPDLTVKRFALRLQIAHRFSEVIFWLRRLVLLHA